MPLNDFDKVRFAKEFLKHFLKGYAMENSLETYWLASIPNFLKLREMVVFEVFNKKWDLENLNEKQKALLEEMRYKIENDIPVLDMDFTVFSKFLKAAANNGEEY
jgi:Ser/Thr protein kinase RdoA (MazF antagonist)